MNSVQAERNRIRRRDKKVSRRKTGMRVDDSARRLAEIKEEQVNERLQLRKMSDGYNIWPGIGMPRL